MDTILDEVMIIEENNIENIQYIDIDDYPNLKKLSDFVLEKPYKHKNKVMLGGFLVEDLNGGYQSGMSSTATLPGIPKRWEEWSIKMLKDQERLLNG